MRYIFIVVGLILGGSIVTNAQSGYQTSHSIFHQQFFNPAYLGQPTNLELFVNYRNQWTNLTDRVVANEGAAFKYPLYKLNSQIGIHLLNDRIGLLRSTYLAVDYAYIIKAKKSRISLGLSLGFIQSKLRGSELRAPDGVYLGGGVDHQDVLIPNIDVSGLAPDVSFGVFYHIGAFKGGVSMSQLLNSSINIVENTTSTAINYSRTFVTYLEYQFKLGNNFGLKPSYLLKTDFVNTQTDITAMLGYKEKFYGGLGYRGYNNSSNDAVILLIGLNFIRNLGVNYSYDISVSSLGSFNNGSHEISLTYNMGVRDKTVKRGKIIYNPRFL